MPNSRSVVEVRQLLRAAGMRVTSSRIAVLEVLNENPHATADAVARLVAAHLGSVSKQAVSDVRAACPRGGGVRKSAPAGSAALFETRTGDNHHHLVCRRCGRTEDVDCAVGRRPCLTPSDDAGFAVDEAEVVFWGLCPGCQDQTQSAGTGASPVAHHHNHSGVAA